MSHTERQRPKMGKSAVQSATAVPDLFWVRPNCHKLATLKRVTSDVFADGARPQRLSVETTTRRAILEDINQPYPDEVSVGVEAYCSSGDQVLSDVEPVVGPCAALKSATRGLSQ